MTRLFAILLLVVSAMMITKSSKASRNFSSSSSQYAALQSAAITGYPATLSAWVRPSSTTATYAVLSVQNKAESARFAILALAGGAFRLDVIPTNNGVGFALQSPSSYAAGSWYHVCAVFESSTSRNLYVNGVNVTNDTVSAPMTNAAGINVTYIGTRGNNGPLGLYADAQIRSVSIWAAALNANQVSALGAGMDPRAVSSTAPVFYAPLWGEASPEINVVGAAVSLTNSPTKGSSDPRLYLQ